MGKISKMIRGLLVAQLAALAVLFAVTSTGSDHVGGGGSR